MKLRRWDVRSRPGYLTDQSGRLSLFWTKRGAFIRAAWINDQCAAHDMRARCYIVDRWTGEHYYAKDAEGATA